MATHRSTATVAGPSAGTLPAAALHGLATMSHLVLSVLVLLCAAGFAAAAPVATAPAVGLVHDDPADNPEGAAYLSVTGAGFGSPRARARRRGCGRPGTGTKVQLHRDGALVEQIAAGDAAVVHWRRRHIVLRLPPQPTGTTVRVCTPRGKTRKVPIENWDYRHVDVPPSDGTNASPLALAVDRAGDVWINEEFHLQLKTFVPSAAAFAAFDIPVDAANPPFATSFGGGDNASVISESGEDVTVDPFGRVWLTQGGGGPKGGHPNHSRVVAFDPNAPAGQRFAAYNVPGNENGVVGVAWDERRRRVWFTEGARRTDETPPVAASRARVVSFDPQQILPVNEFGFPVTAGCTPSRDPDEPGRCTNVPSRACLDAFDCILAEQVCRPAPGSNVVDETGCYHEYELPVQMNTAMPGHIAIHPDDGAIWVTAYFGSNAVGRLEPETGRFLTFRLPDPFYKRDCDYDRCTLFCDPADPGCRPCSDLCTTYAVLGSAPWEITVDSTGSVLFTEYNNNAIGEILPVDHGDPFCDTVAPGRNSPCIYEYFIPGADPEHQQVHSLALDAAQNVWFTQGDDMTVSGSTSSVGYLRADRRGIVLLPPLSVFPFANTDGTFCGTTVPLGGQVNFNGAGITVDPADGTVWFADYCRKRLGSLRRL